MVVICLLDQHIGAGLDLWVLPLEGYLIFFKPPYIFAQLRRVKIFWKLPHACWYPFFLDWNETKAVSREEILNCSSRSCLPTSCWEQEDSALIDRVPLDEGWFPVVLYRHKRLWLLQWLVWPHLNWQLSLELWIRCLEKLPWHWLCRIVLIFRFSSSFLISNNKLLSCRNNWTSSGKPMLDLVLPFIILCV